MQSRIRVEQKKAEESTIKVNALQEEYWRLEGRLDVAKELVRKQSLLNAGQHLTGDPSGSKTNNDVAAG